MKKKILFLLPGFNFGGTVFSTLNMISFLKKDYDIFVLPMTYQGPVIKKYKDEDINLLPESVALSAMMGRLDREPSLLKKAIYIYHKVMRRMLGILGFDYEQFLFNREAKRIENNYHFDYVASCQEGGSTYFASCFTKSPKIAWFRSEYSIYRCEHSQGALDKDQRIYPSFNNIVCVSETTRDDFVKFFTSIKNKVVAIHNIQNVDNIQSKANENITDFPQSSFVIVSIGRINPQKRFSCIPSIARKMLDAGCDFRWLIIGDGNDLCEWDKIHEEINKNKVEESVLCLGAKLNPYPYIKSSQLLVNTSYVEACPRVVIEAKILKTPVVCANFSSAREFVTSGCDGFVSEIENIHEPIINLIKDIEAYKRIKNTCEAFEMDNKCIMRQLKQLFL